MNAKKENVIMVYEGDRLVAINARDPKSRKNIFYTCTEQSADDTLALLNIEKNGNQSKISESEGK